MPPSPLASIALNRFGLGARASEPPPADPRRWLLNQFSAYQPRPPAIAAAPTSAAVSVELADYVKEQRELRAEYGPRRAAKPAQAVAAAGVDPTEAGTPRAGMAPAVMPAASDAAARADDPFRAARRFANGQARGDYTSLVGARVTSALTTDAPFVERLVHFWANHFAVSADKLTVIGLAGTLETEAIRPHVLGSFREMLFAVETHPAMLLYLDQAVSVGPDSDLGRRVAARGNRKVGLNENLAREILELHTLGVRTGYRQADVTEFARALTGLTVSGIGGGPGARLLGLDGAPGRPVFADALHEPGVRTIIGRRYAEVGQKQAEAVLTDLAASPATANHLATKLARHFAGDTPPPAMVARLSAAYLASGGDLPTVYRAIIDSPEAWVPQPVKFRTPWEWSIAAMRALGVTTAQPQATVGLMNQLGQPVWKPGQPVGYDDVAASWAGPDAVLRRVEAAERFAQRAGPVDARALAPRLFPGTLTPATAQAIARAESPGQALALLLVSPEMMRR